MFDGTKRKLMERILWFPESTSPTFDDPGKFHSEEVKIDWPDKIKRPFVGLTQDCNAVPYWTKYASFLEKNGFPYSIYEYRRSDWIERASKFDLIIWSPKDGPFQMEDIKRKIYILENKLGKVCFPDYDTLLLCDDKAYSTYILSINNLPVIETFISNDYNESKTMADNLSYPLVSKGSFGAGSKEVFSVANASEAKRIVRQVFSVYGKRTHLKYVRQKNLVYFQRFVESDRVDTRVNIIGNMIFGYYRKPEGNDFRASGSGIVIKEDLPIEAIRIALETYSKIGKAMLGVDMLKDRSGKYWISEISPFIYVKTPEQLKVNGIPGTYSLQDDGTLLFEKELFWPQQLALKVFFEQNYLSSVEEWKAKYLEPGLSKQCLRKST